MRRIEGLRHVEFLKERPGCIPQVKLKHQVQREGLNYEHDVAGYLKRFSTHSLFCGEPCYIIPGQWFSYIDANGKGYAQADLIFACPARKLFLVIECKRTYVQKGLDQLEGLYRPLLEHGTKGRVATLLICKHLAQGVERGAILPDFEAWLDEIERNVAAGVPCRTWVLPWRKGWQ